MAETNMDIDDIYRRIEDDTEKIQEDLGQSQIRDFYAGQTILVTGCTGFVGVCFVEKLLRTCTEINKIFAIIRPRKGKSVEERLKKYFEDEFFDTVRRMNPDFHKKFVPIFGDLMQPGLGLSLEDRQLLTEETTLIVHNGASVNFLLKISQILRVNVLGTQEMLTLAKECKRLKAFIYVSTGFSHCHDKYIEEKCYPPPADMKMVHDIIRADTETEGISPAAMKQLVGTYENNYFFSKAIAEGIVEQFAKTVDFACGIFRPTIVISTFNEPVKGWCNNYNGPAGPVIVWALGLLHVARTSKDNIFDAVPLDLTVNALLASIWDLAVFKKPREDCTVYHYSSSLLNPRNFQVAVEQGYEKAFNYPTLKAVWYPSMYFTHSKIVFALLHYTVHFLPAILFDIYLLLQMKKPFAVSLFLLNSKSLDIRTKFTTDAWILEMNQMTRIWKNMNPKDHQEFFCDIRAVDWRIYEEFYFAGLRRYILKDPLETLPAARRKLRILKIINHTTVVIFISFVIFCIYRIASYVIGF